MNARTTALSALIATRRQNAWSDGVLKEYIARDRLDARDAALASRLCYGVLQNRMLLDFYIAYFLNGKLRELQPVVLDILRLGAFQIVFLDKIPVSAAVNEAVEQCKSYANRRAAGLVNGLLRAMARSRDALPEPPDLATKYSHPQKLVELLEEDRVVEVGFPVCVWGVWDASLSGLEAVALGAGVADPLWRGLSEAGLGAGDAEGGLESAFAEALHGGVEDGPVEDALLGFDGAPGESEIDLGESGPVGEEVFWRESRAVVLEAVVVVVEDPAHAGVGEFGAVVVEVQLECAGQGHGGQAGFQ